MPLNLLNYIVNSRGIKLYSSTCIECGVFRGYRIKRDINRRCRKCAGYISRAKLNSNGEKDLSEGLEQISPNERKLRIRLKSGKMHSIRLLRRECGCGHVDWVRPRFMKYTCRSCAKRKYWKNKDNNYKINFRKKISSTLQHIDLKDFKDFKKTENLRERAKFSDAGLHQLCFQRDNFTCRRCGTYGGRLNAHHMNSWKFFPTQRFDLNNLITLCEKCHQAYHKKYGSGYVSPNTKAQMLEFLDLKLV
jgi:5-methylcytosine-specific restriction endonuclease McrA